MCVTDITNRRDRDIIYRWGIIWSVNKCPAISYTSDHLKYDPKETFPLTNLILHASLVELRKTFLARRCKVYRL